mgnify:CR=1 FL=1
MYGRGRDETIRRETPMAARIIWSEKFLKSTDDYFMQYEIIYSRDVLRKLRKGILKYNRILADNPLMGMVEKEIDGVLFRRIIIKPYFKLIYIVEGDTVVFTSIWDTRRAPDKLIRYLTS